MTNPGVKYDDDANDQRLIAKIKEWEQAAGAEANLADERGREIERLRNELAVVRRALADLTEHVFDAAQSAAAAAQLGRMLTDDQGEPEQ